MNNNSNSHILDVYGYNRFRQRIYPFFWFIAAADESLLQRCPVPEQDKQAGIGMAILCTTLAAIISSFYAIQSLFVNWAAAVPLAIFWGVIIFNLDRFMVGSLRKDKQKNLVNELKVASPRILLALLIAILISKPLEVKIFQNQIEAELFNFNNRKETAVLGKQFTDLSEKKSDLKNALSDYKDSEAKKNKYQEDPAYRIAKEAYDNCLKEQAQYEKQLDQARRRRRTLYNNLKEEDNPVLNAQIQNANHQINQLNNQLKTLKCSEKLNTMNSKANEYIQSQEIIVGKFRTRQDSLSRVLQKTDSTVQVVKQSENVKYAKAGSDILGQLRILNSLKKDDNGMLLASWLITTLFFVLELAPLIVKILSPRGEYDSLIAIAERQAFDREEAAEEESRQEKNARKKAALQNTIHVEELDSKVKQRVQEKILGAHADLAEQIVDAWKKQEESNLSTNTQEYLKTKITQTS